MQLAFKSLLCPLPCPFAFWFPISLEQNRWHEVEFTETITSSQTRNRNWRLQCYYSTGKQLWLLSKHPLRVSYIFFLPSNHNATAPNFVPLRNSQNYLGICTILTKATLTIIFLSNSLSSPLYTNHSAQLSYDIIYMNCGILFGQRTDMSTLIFFNFFITVYLIIWRLKKGVTCNITAARNIGNKVCYN